jgi:hypothetical protein
MQRRIYWYLLAVCFSLALVIGHGCHNNDSTEVIAPPSPCDAVDTTTWGTGTCSFSTPGAGDTLSVTGRYKPSSLFSGDTLGEGVGGYAHDTLVHGMRLAAQIAAYHYRMNGSGADERVLVLTISDTLPFLTVGNYDVPGAGTAGIGRVLLGSYLRFNDSLGVYSSYELVSGTISVAAVDTCSKSVAGTFAGLLRGLPPDTAQHIVLRSGVFSLQYVRHAYEY